MINANLISCSKCKGRVPLNDLRADKTGKGWVCISCYSLQHPDLNIRKPTTQQQNIYVQKVQTSETFMNKPHTVEKPMVLERKQSIMAEILKKYNYQCNACKYKFSRNQEYNGMCPFCGKKNTLEDLNVDLEI
ncbi:MAG: hypothetical protein AABW58_03030 [Nanoarchaeota archaeon]